MATTSFIAGSISAGHRAVNANRATTGAVERRFERCTMRAPVLSRACRSQALSIDGPSPDVLSGLTAAVAAVSGTDDVDIALSGVLSAGVGLLRPTVAAIYLSDPDRAGLIRAAAHDGRDGATGGTGTAVDDPDDPFTLAAVGRVADFERTGVSVGGTESTGAYLPLL